jgi:hypothetical protein
MAICLLGLKQNNLYLVVGGAAVGVDDAAGVDAAGVDAVDVVGVGAAVDVGEIVVVVAFDADVASEHASSFVVASYAAVVAAVVSVRLLSFYFGGSKNSWDFLDRTGHNPRNILFFCEKT